MYQKIMFKRLFVAKYTGSKRNKKRNYQEVPLEAASYLSVQEFVVREKDYGFELFNPQSRLTIRIVRENKVDEHTQFQEVDFEGGDMYIAQHRGALKRIYEDYGFIV